jgi:hypothetical protein
MRTTTIAATRLGFAESARGIRPARDREETGEEHEIQGKPDGDATEARDPKGRHTGNSFRGKQKKTDSAGLLGKL